MSNPMRDYVDNFRANLPSGVTFESITARYFFNGKRFISEWDVERYREYLIKFGYSDSTPSQMGAPSLVGGDEEATLTLNTSVISDGGSTITGYDYEVTDSADTGFASPTAQGTQTPGNLGNAITVSPLTAGDYIARSRAENGVGNGAWSAASTAATVTSAGATDTIPFGELTNVGAGAASISESDGTYGEFDVASGVITPNTSPLTVGSTTIGSTTINVTAGQATAASNSELNTVMAGNRTVMLRDGSYGGGRGTIFDTRNFGLGPCTVSAYNRAGVVFGETWVEDSSNIILDNLTFARSGGTQLVLYNTTSNITIQNCDIYGTVPMDTSPSADYSTTPPTLPTGIIFNGTATNISILNNEIHNVQIGVTTGGGAGTLRIEGNSIHTCYEDCIKITKGPTSVNISDNFLAGVVANGSNDLNNPHPDLLQFIGGGSSDWTGITIDRNILLHLYDRAAAQGIFMDDQNAGFYYSGAKIRGNLLINGPGITTGIRLRQAKNCEIYGNTVVSRDSLGGQRAGITVGDDTFTGTTIVKNNVAHGFDLNGTVTTDNNVTIGNDQANFLYSALFSGTGFEPTTRAEALLEFAMKANGPLDVDNSGGPSVGDVGAIGSGYVTLPSVFPGNDGSLDASYE